jgi:hypothetical protein
MVASLGKLFFGSPSKCLGRFAKQMLDGFPIESRVGDGHGASTVVFSV